MNYIGLINQYWQLREQGIISGPEGDLYLYLIHTSNKLAWKNPFNQSNGFICAVLNMSEPTLIRHRNSLKQLGLIRFESGKATKKSTLYYLNYFSSSVSSSVSSVVSSSVSSVGEKPLDNNKLKIVIIEYPRVIDFFKQTINYRQIAEKYKINVEAKFKEFYDQKVDLGDFDNKSESDIVKHFGYWIPKNLIIENDQRQKFKQKGVNTSIPM